MKQFKLSRFARVLVVREYGSLLANSFMSSSTPGCLERLVLDHLPTGMVQQPHLDRQARSQLPRILHTSAPALQSMSGRRASTHTRVAAPSMGTDLEISSN
jgi:hypothetical protein